ncbi:MAG TPA: hypothetical protein PKD19_03385 [Candidatus Saccharibacteria bacterium]|nr:hypothetical protein [Candidatus Saccharibacteria bacterium]
MAVTENSNSASTLLSQIETALESATEHVSEMDTAYSDFTTIKAKIDDPDTGLAVTLTEIKSVRGRAKAAAAATETTLKTANTALATIQERIPEIDEAYDEFLASKKKIDDPTDGLEAILVSMQGLRDSIAAVAEKSKTAFAKITSYRDEASSSLKDIKASEESAATALDTIQNHESESQTAKDNIDRLLKISSQNTSTAYFKRRARFVTITAGAWLVIGIVALVVAILLGHELVNDILKNNNVSVATVIARAFVVTPVLAFSFYAFRNYGKERTIAEQYAFKEISGATLEGHVEMAHRAFDGSETIDGNLEEAVDCVIKSLHTEPSELQKSPKNVFRVKSKLMNIEAEISDIGDNVEDIKDMVSKSDNSQSK